MCIAAASVAAAIVVALAVGIPVGIAQRNKASGTVDDGCSYTDYMLRPYASPSSYNIYWNTQLVAPFAVQGRTDIDVDITANGLRCVQLHAVSFNITSISVDAGAGAQPVASWSTSAANQRIIVPLPGTFNTGTRRAATA
ncbi:hypothetical protein EON62_02250, partial [archaeon]